MSRPALVPKILFSLLLTGPAFCQSLSSLTGTVVDPTGRVIPRAEITLTALEAPLTRKTVTDESGFYGFPQMLPGKYRLSAKAASFAERTYTGIELLVNTPTTLPVQLELGSVSTAISVEENASQINLTDASLGNAIGSRPILELPLEARNPTLLLTLQGGVTYYGSETDNPNSSASRLNGSVNGSKPDQNNITLDGVDVNDQNTRSPLNSVLRVTLDSVQEFRTTTQNPTADQGRTSGAQIALVTRGGTNTIHGSLYEFNRNTATSANTFFNNLSGLPRQKLNRNVAGGSVGGPLKKDHLFLFANYEGRRDTSESTAVRLVPTAAFRQGTLQYLTAAGGVSTISPAQLRALDPQGKGVSSAVLATLNKYPMPNDNTQGDGLNTAGYRFSAATPTSQNTYIAKLDYAAGRNNFFLRGNLQGDKTGQLPEFPGQPAASNSLDHSKGMAFGWTLPVKANLVSSFRYGLTRYGHENTGAVSSAYVTLQGLSPLQSTSTDLTRIIPVNHFSEDMVWTAGKHDVSFGGVVRVIRNSSVNFATAYPTASVAPGYLEQAGFGLVPADLNYNYSLAYRNAAVDLLGPVTLASATYTYDLKGNLAPFGQGLKRRFGAEEYEFYVTDAWRVTKSLTVNYGLRYSLAPPIYETNGYQVSPSINLGDWFYKRGELANEGKSQADAGQIGFLLAGSNGAKPLYDTQKRNFAPRLAVVYSPAAESGLGRFLFGGPGKTSIRAGAGMFYELFGMSIMRNFDSNAPGLTSLVRSPFGAPLATQPRYSDYGVIPSGVLPAAPQGGFPSVPGPAFSIANTIDQDIKQPYTINLNLSISREFAHGWLAQGSYVGRLSRRSITIGDLAQSTNLKDPKSGQTYYDALNALSQQARHYAPVSSIKPQPFFENMFSKYASGGLTATQQIYAQEVSYYPTDLTSVLFDLDVYCYVCSNLGSHSMFNSQYAALFAYRSVGKGNYHAMQWRVSKRSSSTLVDFNYTMSKSTDLTSSPESEFSNGVALLLSPYNASLNRGVSDFDVRHSVNGSVVYQLPVGKGQRFLSSLPKPLETAVGGWQVGSILVATSGLPRSVLNSGSWPTSWSFSGFATAISTPPATTNSKNAPAVSGVGGPNLFSDPKLGLAAFDYSYAGQVGSRNVLRGDGFFTWDMSLSKRFVMPFRETHSVQFRAEVFNLPNAVRFDIGTASLDVGNTATFGKYTSTLTTPRVMQFGLRYDF